MHRWVLTLSLVVVVFGCIYFSRETLHSTVAGKIAPNNDGSVATGPSQDGKVVSNEKRTVDSTLIEFPFIGKVSTHIRQETVTWTSPEGKVLQFPFKFHYNDSGVWVRAEYTGSGTQYDETPKDELEVLYHGAGETIIGFPSEPPKVSMQEFLTGVHNRVAFEKASRIVVDYVLLTVEPQETEPYLIIKIWGAEYAWEDRPGVPRIRIILGMNSGIGFLDDAL
jgi:hypothetical protein